MNIATPPAIVLSPQQEAAAVAAKEWFHDPDRNSEPFVLSGFAGTGKSFTTKIIVDRLGANPWYGAYTGKAALVQHTYNNVDASTIHSKIYKLVRTPDDVFQKLYEHRDTATTNAERKEIQNEIDHLLRPRFEFNQDAFKEDSEDLIVLDECSMVDAEMLADLKSYGIPILALGDPGQLPPVKGEGALFAGIPNACLTEVRRQALDNPIIAGSMAVRNLARLPMTDPETWKDNALSVIPKAYLSHYNGMWNEMCEAHDVIICWKNSSRMNVNRDRRKQLGLGAQSYQFPTVGDRLIFTKNDRKEGIFNGLFCEVRKVGELFDTTIELTVAYETDPDTEHTYKFLRAPFEYYDEGKAAFDRLKTWDYRGVQQADFGYCLTCHKAQGSQWPRVLIVEENVFNWPGRNGKPGYEERGRWLYTAITRAAEKCTIIMGK